MSRDEAISWARAQVTRWHEARDRALTNAEHHEENAQLLRPALASMSLGFADQYRAHADRMEQRAAALTTLLECIEP